MKTSETLNKAADLIEERGWKSRGGWQYADSRAIGLPVCLEGGIQAASGHAFRSIQSAPAEDEMETLQSCPAYRAVADYLDGQPLLYMWNDAPERTAEQVIEALRAAAVIEAARESADDRDQVSA